jgi:hypothetical protein
MVAAGTPSLAIISFTPTGTLNGRVTNSISTIGTTPTRDIMVLLGKTPCQPLLSLLPHCPKSSLENILAPKFSQPACGYCQFSFRNFYSAISKEEIPLAYGKISLP